MSVIFFVRRLDVEPLGGQVQKDGNRVAHQPYAAPDDDAPDKDTRYWVRIGPARKIDNDARDDDPYGRKGVAKDVEPYAFEVKIFMAVAEDEGHDKISHEAKDGNPQHDRDVDPGGRHQAFRRIRRR